jgi:branched-chain amino acid transport system ATP-binding protein
MLKIDGIESYYGKIQALKGVSFHVEEGEIVSLIGANGAGKTTTLLSVSGIVKPKKGKIYFKGERIDTLSPDKIVMLGISQVPEGRRIFPYLTVRENLNLGAYLRKDKAGVKEDLDKVFNFFPILKERINQDAGTLSGGEQQMLAIGRALMSKPRVLLLDEPSLGLAPKIVDLIFNIILEINKNGGTILLVEQNANMALKISNRAYVLETGAVKLEGNAEELMNNEEVKKAYLGES